DRFDWRSLLGKLLRQLRPLDAAVDDGDAHPFASGARVAQQAVGGQQGEQVVEDRAPAGRRRPLGLQRVHGSAPYPPVTASNIARTLSTSLTQCRTAASPCRTDSSRTASTSSSAAP